MFIQRLQILFIFTILLNTFSVCAGVNPMYIADEFSEWQHAGTFRNTIMQIPSSKYPVVIQGGVLLGDGIAFRMLLVDKPSSDLQYEYLYDVDESTFIEQNEIFIKNGYTLIQHRTLQIMHSIIHQAIWIK
jgi:hypothetical protein